MKCRELIGICLAIALPLIVGCAETDRPGGIVISGNENKIDLTSGTPKPILNAPPDSLSIIDFATFPPEVTTIDNVPNTVVGPPSNIAISPDGKMALVANSLKLDATAPAGWVPESYVHIVDLTAHPPRVVGQVKTDAQPSGLSISPDGTMAIVANRAAGTVNVLAIDGLKVTSVQSLKVCEPAESPSDVAISPDGKMALVSIQKGGVLAVLNIEGGKVTATNRKISVFGQPYRVVITPDGALALTPGTGYGNGLDQDAMSVIDLKAPGGPKTTAFLPVGTNLESMEISPDGKLAAVVAAEGSSTGPENPTHSSAGALVIFKRDGQTYRKTQYLPIGRIPEGVAFTNNGKYLLVQCHPDRKIWIFEVGWDGNVKDTGRRIETPGMPSSLRAAIISKAP
jgi:DNA-binding beta-propeller fold protein YncE